MERGEPLLNIPARDAGNRPAPEPGQDMVPVVPEIDPQCAWLPVPPVTPEDLFGHHLERDFEGVGSGLFTVPPRPQHGSCLRAGILQRDVFGIADRMPDPIAADLAVEEVAFAAGRQDSDTETGDFGIANVTGFPARLE